MKKTITLFTLAMCLTIVSSYGQSSNRKIKSDSIEAFVINSEKASKSPQFVAPADPIIYNNEVDFNTAIGGDKYLNNFDDCSFSNEEVYILNYSYNNYSYNITDTQDNMLYVLDGAISVPVSIMDLIFTNTGKPIKAFGGYFYNTNENDEFISDNIVINIDGYTHTFPAITASSFIGFIFNTNIQSISVHSENGTDYYATADHVYFSAASPVGVEKVTTKNGIYPNPTTDGIYVNETGTVSIYNLSGQLEIKKELTANSYLSLSDLAKGTYIVKIETENSTTQEKLIVE